MRRADPIDGSIMGKLQLALKITDMPGLINDFRLAAHTAQLGKSKEQCIAEFKEQVVKLYGRYKVKLPQIRPIPTPLPIEAPSEPKLQGIGSLGSRVDENIPPGGRSGTTSYYTGDGNLAVASQENILVHAEEIGSEIKNLQVYFPGKRVETIHERLLKGIAAFSPHGNRQAPKLLSKEWWLTPDKGIAAIGGAVATTALLGGGFWLWKKWGQWRQRKEQKWKLYKRRLHPRSWAVSELG